MFWRLFIMISIAAFAGCKPTMNTSKTDMSVQQATRFQIQIQLASIEAVKRVPLRYEKFRIQLNEEIARDQHLYQASIECRPYEIDGVIEKMKLDDEIVDVRRVE
jgi:hypothetical protein